MYTKFIIEVSSREGQNGTGTSTIATMFVLRKNENSPIDANALYMYWREITTAIKEISAEDNIVVPGKLLR